MNQSITVESTWARRPRMVLLTAIWATACGADNADIGADARSVQAAVETMVALEGNYTTERYPQTTPPATGKILYFGDIGARKQAYLKFDLRGTQVARVSNAVLRFRPRSNVVCAIHSVADDSWSETALTWNNQPALGITLATPSLITYQWLDVDVTDYVNTQLVQDRVVSIAIVGSASSGNLFSDNDKNYPELVLTPAVACTDACTALGETRCNSNVVERCAQDNDGCRTWVEDSDCTASGELCDESAGLAECTTRRTFKVGFILTDRSDDASGVTQAYLDAITTAKKAMPAYFEQATLGRATVDVSAPTHIVASSALPLPNTSFDAKRFVYRDFYATHDDVFDFIVLMTATRDPSVSYNPHYNRFQSRTHGTGRSSYPYGAEAFDNLAYWDLTPGMRVLGSAFLGTMLLDQPSTRVNANAITHELGHQWGVRGPADYDYLNPTDGNALKSTTHWTFALANPYPGEVCVMGGGAWTPMDCGIEGIDDCYMGNSLPTTTYDQKYHPLQLYFMGLLPRTVATGFARSHFHRSRRDPGLMPGIGVPA